MKSLRSKRHPFNSLRRLIYVFNSVVDTKLCLSFGRFLQRVWYSLIKDRVHETAMSYQKVRHHIFVFMARILASFWHRL